MNPIPQEAAHSVDQVMGLVGQRRQLVGEIERIQQNRLQIAERLKVASGNERRVLEDMANHLDRQATGAENALRAIETLIAAQSRSVQPAAPVPVSDKITYAAVPPPPPEPGISMRDMWVLSTGTLAIVALAAVAGFGYLRRVRREATQAAVQLRSELWDEMKKVSIGVDAIAVELERIGEGQRFVTKAIAEKKEPTPRAESS